MSTVDNVWGNVKAALNIAGEKTTKAYELSKKKLWERKLEDRLEELYVTLGKLSYTNEKKGTCDRDAVEKTVILIDNTKAELKAIRAEINSIRFDKICPVCNAGMKKDDEFCGKCGSKVE